MSASKWFARGLVLAAVVVGTACGATDGFEADDTALFENDASKADGIASTSTFFKFRRDMRRCVSPLCGGYWMSRVNRAQTKCVNGTWAAECYVAELDSRGIGDVGIDAASILRGDIKSQTYTNFGNMGKFVVKEAWAPASTNVAVGTFYRATDSGIRCIRAPCNSIHEAKLNSTTSANVSGIDFSATGATDDEITAAQAAPASGGILAVGKNRPERNGGTTLALTQFYRKLTGVQSNERACTRASDCVLTAVNRPVNSVDECYCAFCPTTALSSTTAASYQASYTAFCSTMSLHCPLAPCIQPPPVACVNRQCVTQPR